MAAAFVSVAACLLVVAGVAKVVHPEPASDALAVLGLSVPLVLVRLFAALEILIAMAALFVSGPIPSVLVGASYLGFAGFVALLRRDPDAGSCGCFGATEEPPSLRHVIVNVLIGAGCLVAALSSSPSTASLLREDWPRGLLFVVLSVVAAWLVGLVLRSTQWSAR
jgi:hypothetical protein